MNKEQRIKHKFFGMICLLEKISLEGIQNALGGEEINSNDREYSRRVKRTLELFQASMNPFMLGAIARYIGAEEEWTLYEFIQRGSLSADRYLEAFRIYDPDSANHYPSFLESIWINMKFDFSQEDLEVLYKTALNQAKNKGEFIPDYLNV